MSPRRKACFGSRDAVCRTPSCPLMAGCVRAVWEERSDEVLATARAIPKRTAEVARRYAKRGRRTLGLKL